MILLPGLKFMMSVAQTSQKPSRYEFLPASDSGHDSGQSSSRIAFCGAILRIVNIEARDDIDFWWNLSFDIRVLRRH